VHSRAPAGSTECQREKGCSVVRWHSKLLCSLCVPWALRPLVCHGTTGWTVPLLGWSASQRRKPSMEPVLSFQPSFLPSSKQRLCFQAAAAKNTRLISGWDPSFPDSANSCCCSQLTSHSKPAAATTLRQLSSSWLPNPVPRLPVIHRKLSQLILKAKTAGWISGQSSCLLQVTLSGSHSTALHRPG